MVPWWRSIALKFVGLFTFVAVSLNLAALIFLIEREKQGIQDKFGLALRVAAATSAPFIRGEDLDAIHTDADVGSEAWKRTRAILQQVRTQNALREDQVYILRPAREGTDRYQFVVMLQESTFVGDVYWPPAAVAARYRKVLQERALEQTELFSDAHGTFISGMAPVLRGDGSVAGILQVDYGVGEYLTAVERERDVLFMGVVAMLGLFLLAGEYLRRWLNRSVQHLLSGTRAIERENYDFIVRLEGRDELTTVAVALNVVLRKLKERFEMLKFLPRHTARMIQLAVTGDGVKLSNGQRVHVTVLNSDIRGFTRMSELLPPERVIAILNEYIRVQAELVEGEGGSIDKFMGDAVLAIFEGPDASERAVAASVAIQEAVARMNAAGLFQGPVLVGVGLCSGEVVMGNMGSHQRMEYTVIGSPVNLASRLCGLAGPGEIVMTAEMRDALGSVDGLASEAPEELAVKGFDNRVRVVRCRAGRAIAGDRPTLW